VRKPLGTTLLIAGAVIAAAGAVGLAMGVHVTIPPALLAVAEYKAPFIIGAGLMLLGAGLRGRARRPVSVAAPIAQSRSTDRRTPTPSVPSDAGAPPASGAPVREPRR
jgi:hypothetical protein